MGLPLKAPLTPKPVIYTLPMLTIKEDKGMPYFYHKTMVGLIFNCNFVFLSRGKV